MVLSELKANTEAVVSGISGDARFISRITSIGLTTGCRVQVIKNDKNRPVLLDDSSQPQGMRGHQRLVARIGVREDRLLTAKIFGRGLVKSEDKCGMIMELPPYHKPKWGALMRYVFGRTKDTFFRVVKGRYMHTAYTAFVLSDMTLLSADVISYSISMNVLLTVSQTCEK